MLENEYSDWLKHEHYQPQTIQVSISSTRTLEKRWAQAPLTYSPTTAQKPLFKRYSRFVRTIPQARWGLFEHFVAERFEPARGGAQLGSSTKPPLNKTQWRALIAKLDESKAPVDKALLFISSISTLEAVTVLNLPLTQLATYLTPSLRARLKKLEAYASLSNAISESERSAYVRVHRRLQQVGDELGFDVDFRSIARTPADVRASAKLV